MNTLEKILLGTDTVLPIDGLKKKLEKNIPLVVKLGADPTAPNLHLGHAVVLSKLKQLQEMGHQIIFLIGDFTARIGDPTGKSKTRPPLTEEEILINTKTYVQQLSRILDINKTVIRYNSEWLDKMTSREWIKLCGQVTLARIIEREDFKNRIQNQSPIGFHELLYPLLQGYDSVELEADIELGGTDQTFNLLMGRHLQEQLGKEPQIIITMPILEGLDGIKKMSKSLKNDIGLTEAPEEVFGKIMSIPDSIIKNYYRLLLHYSEEELNAIGLIHPKEAKKELAYKILEKIWSKEDAEIGKNHFEQKFEKKEYDEIAEELIIEKNQINIVDLCLKASPELSKSEIKRLLEQGSITLNGSKIIDFKAIILLQQNDLLKIGKRKFFKIIKKNLSIF